MRVLLDTHAWLWFVLGDPALSPAARRAIEDPDNEMLVSPASFWETAIKISIGKYSVSEPYATFVHRAVEGQGFGVLPIRPSRAAAVCSLPFHHRDPFDRLLAAQAQVEGLPIVSGDAVLDAYGVVRICKSPLPA